MREGRYCLKLTPLRGQDGRVAHVAQSLSTPTSHNTTAHRPSDLNLCSARVLPAPPTADTQSRAWGGERERGEVGVTSVVQFVRARAPLGLLAGGRAICYNFPPQVLRALELAGVPSVVRLVAQCEVGGRPVLVLEPFVEEAAVAPSRLAGAQAEGV